MTAKETIETETGSANKKETLELETIHEPNMPSSSNRQNDVDESNNCRVLEMCECLAKNSNIVFKSQQIDDPEITEEEKFEMAKTLFDECKLKFLRKFGQYLTKEQLLIFQQVQGNSIPSENYELTYLFNHLASTLDHRQTIVKNRRFTALKKMLLTQDDFFSELEMMKREPTLYDQLVGQYLTANEKNIRDGYNPKTTLFSEIILNNYDRDQQEKLQRGKKSQEELEFSDDVEDDDESTRTSFTSNEIAKLCTDKKEEETFPKIPSSYRKKWGGFEDDEANCSNKVDSAIILSEKNERTRLMKLKQKGAAKNYSNRDSNKFITSGEREMLRQEFLSIMRSKFIDGDINFDYSKIDDDSSLDDLEQINQDCEDKYFDEDDGDDDDDNTVHRSAENSIEDY